MSGVGDETVAVLVTVVPVNPGSTATGMVMVALCPAGSVPSAHEAVRPTMLAAALGGGRTGIAP